VLFRQFIDELSNLFNRITSVYIISDISFLVSLDVDVPVVGGHAGITILPLFSQVVKYSLFIFLIITV
jgi:malate/lactate dehydrogenase